MNRRRISLCAATVSIVLVAGCGDEANDNSRAASTATDASTTANASLPPTIAAPEGSIPVSDQIDAGLQPFIDFAVADLANRLSVAPSDIGVISATLRTWPDASLGCPQPDMSYAQVSTDGSLIVLTVDGNSYRYHSGGSRKPFLCEHPAKFPRSTG